MPVRPQIMSSRSIKNGLAAFLLSVLTPGLGQIFNGQLWKGVFSYGGLLGFLLLSTAIGLTHSFMGMTIYLILSLSAYVFVLGEAVFTAVQQARMDHRPLHTWRSYVAGLTLLLIAVFAVRPNIPEIVAVRAYKITADSMLPTLASGDRIIADMTYYRSNTPRRGDLIVFRFPYQDHPFYVKRVIGVPGDRIKIVDQHVYLNGQQQNEPFAYYDSAADYDPLMHKFPPVSTDELVSSMQPEWANQVLNDVDKGEIVVPPNTYFTMGDNRNHSWDSRYWGPVAGDKIFGKALYVYWSDDKSRIGQTIH
jgi:signal peptidase I